eukprot:1576278-Amphidinium_carterae.1
MGPRVPSDELLPVWFGAVWAVTAQDNCTVLFQRVFLVLLSVFVPEGSVLGSSNHNLPVFLTNLVM